MRSIMIHPPAAGSVTRHENSAVEVLRTEIVEAVASGAVELCFAAPLAAQSVTPALVAWAKLKGVPRVVLDVEPSAVDGRLARRLASAQLDLARVSLPWGDRGAVDPEAGWGAESREWSALRALRRAEIQVELRVKVSSSKTDDILDLPAWMVATELGLSRLMVELEPLGDLTGHQQRLVSRCLEELVGHASRHAVELLLSPSQRWPPCLFERPSRVAHLFAFGREPATSEGYGQLPVCRECHLSERCAGFPRAFLASHDSETASQQQRPRPLVGRMLLRRFGSGRESAEQVERELVSDSFVRSPAGGRGSWVRTIRLNFRCNQACHFCFVSTHLPAAPEHRIRSCLIEAGRRRMDIALSGGEPTLNPRLSEYIELARRAGVGGIELQTNAVLLGDAQRLKELRQAGLTMAFVSLHGASAAIGDAVTAAPGTWEKTLGGLDELQRQGVRTRISFVLCVLNAESFPDLVRLVAQRWPSFPITFSFVAPSTDLVPRSRDLIPRYSDVLPFVKEGLDIASELGIEVDGFASMCGLPLCLKPGGAGDVRRLAEVAEDNAESEMMKPPPCKSCRASTRCFGIRRGYVELYGYDELRPLVDESQMAGWHPRGPVNSVDMTNGVLE